MQMLLLEKLALTFAGDAYVLAAGAGGIAVGLVTAPIERIAMSCDVTGAYAHRRQLERVSKGRRLRMATLAWRRRREQLLNAINPFRGLLRLT